MNISPEEQADLDKLKADQQKQKVQTFEFLQHILSLDADGLRHSGYKSIPEACHKVMITANNKIINLAKAHVKKWPD